jgi:hypothetical protein
MPDPKLSLPQRALLLILMAENAELSNAQIREKYAPGLELTGKPRVQLVDEKLIECEKRERNAYFFKLADEGWNWCRKELTRAVPENSGSAGHAFYAVLRGLDRYLGRANLKLKQVFGTEPHPEQAPAVGEEPASAATAPADEIEREIRRAYRKVDKSPSGWATLADIRDRLPGFAKRDVDGVLRLMARMPGVQIEEDTNQKTLTQRDRDAAVNIGDRDQHVLAIGAP